MRTNFETSQNGSGAAVFRLPLQIHHLRSMTDDIGLIQHARLSSPNYDEGYSIDDNARGLILMIQLSKDRHENSDSLCEMAHCYLRYISHAWNLNRRRFRNFQSADHRWLEEQGSEDCHGRALHALGYGSGCSSIVGIADHARDLFEEALPTTVKFTSPRAWAFALIGIDEYLKYNPDQCGAVELRKTLAFRLMDLYNFVADDKWLWFEDVLSYCNAKIPHALLLSGYEIGHEDMVRVSLDSLTWLAQIHASDEGLFVPIGSNGFYRKGGKRARFDQQPIEAHASVAASLDAYRLTSNEFWLHEAVRAFKWFHGDNDLGVRVCNPETGSCYDGLHQDRVNQNLGAESTLAYLLSCVDLARISSKTSDKQQVQRERANRKDCL
jgi:hypothetical protein